MDEEKGIGKRRKSRGDGWMKRRGEEGIIPVSQKQGLSERGV